MFYGNLQVLDKNNFQYDFLETTIIFNHITLTTTFCIYLMGGSFSSRIDVKGTYDEEEDNESLYFKSIWLTGCFRIERG